MPPTNSNRSKIVPACDIPEKSIFIVPDEILNRGETHLYTIENGIVKRLPPAARTYYHKDTYTDVYCQIVKLVEFKNLGGLCSSPETK